MIKSLALVVILVFGIGASVLLIQRATQFNSQAFSVSDFVDFFHASVGESRFNADFDVNGDGIINSVDVLKDRYSQEATNSGTDYGNLDKILDASNSGEATGSGTEI